MITSKTNPQVKEIKKLFSSSKRRNEEGLFVVEGARMVEEVPHELLKQIYVTEGFMKRRKDIAGEALLEILKGDNVEVVTEDVYKAITDTVTPQGIMAVVKQPEYSLEKILSEADKHKKIIEVSANLEDGAIRVSDKQINKGNQSDCENIQFVLLDDIRDPGNLGTIVRTSEAAGVKAIIMSPGCVDIFNPKVIRSTMGSIYRVPFVVCELPDAIGNLKKTGVGVYGAALEGSVSYKDVEYGKKNAFIIGNEARGISEKVLGLTDGNIRIPMQGKVESLNAAISLAVLLFR